MHEPPFVARTRDGNTTNPGEAVFPIVKQVGENFESVGTAFFISTEGVFVTAWHVLQDVLDADGRQTRPIGAVQFLPNNEYLVRSVIRCAPHAHSDLAIGVLARAQENETAESLKNKILTLTREVPHIDSEIVTYAYPEAEVLREGKKLSMHFRPNYYPGKFEEHYPEGRGRHKSTFPCYQGTVRLESGSSGGPVLDEQGRVFGVNCSSMLDPPTAFFARVEELLELWVSNVKLSPAENSRDISIHELAQKGHIIFDPPLPHSAAFQP